MSDDGAGDWKELTLEQRKAVAAQVNATHMERSNAPVKKIDWAKLRAAGVVPPKAPVGVLAQTIAEVEDAELLPSELEAIRAVERGDIGHDPALNVSSTGEPHMDRQPTPWAVWCQGAAGSVACVGRIFLTREEYEAQSAPAPIQLWACPVCGGSATWDGEWGEHFGDEPDYSFEADDEG